MPDEEFPTIIDLIGKPYVADGRGPDGYDCYGLALEVARRRGVALPEVGPLGTPERSAELLAATEPQFIRLDGPRPGCLVTFALRPPWVAHVGTVLSCGRRFIHVMRACRVVVERLDSLPWPNKIRGYYWYE